MFFWCSSYVFLFKNNELLVVSWTAQGGMIEVYGLDVFPVKKTFNMKMILYTYLNIQCSVAIKKQKTGSPV